MMVAALRGGDVVSSPAMAGFAADSQDPSLRMDAPSVGDECRRMAREAALHGLRSDYSSDGRSGSGVRANLLARRKVPPADRSVIADSHLHRITLVVAEIGDPVAPRAE